MGCGGYLSRVVAEVVSVTDVRVLCTRAGHGVSKPEGAPLEGCKAVRHERDLFCWRNGLDGIQNGCQLSAEARIELAIMMLNF